MLIKKDAGISKREFKKKKKATSVYSKVRNIFAHCFLKWLLPGMCVFMICGDKNAKEEMNSEE